MKLYHGSSRKLKVLKPRQATGLSKKADRQVGVYATHKKDRAIVMTLISMKGIEGGSRLRFPKGRVQGIIYEGWPKQKYFYLYTLPMKTFKSLDGWQWFSTEKIVPLKVEKLETKDYIHLVRKGTEREKKEYMERLKKFEEKEGK